MRRVLVLLALFLSLPARAAQTTVSFDSLLPDPGEYINDASVSVGPVTFDNSYVYDEEYSYESWTGFALSTVSNTTANAFTNQYAAAEARPGAYTVAYDDGWNPAPEIRFDIPAAPKSVQINNTTYAALTLRDGDAYGFSQPFSDGDYFLLTLTARDSAGNPLAVTNHYLADFRDGRSFIQTHWTPLDLSWMPPAVASLTGTLETTDIGAWGPNTPMYFALADLAYAYSDGSDGIASTNPALACWADGVTAYIPGPNVDAQWQTPANATGAAAGSLGGLGATNGLVSLGDGGQITLTFPAPVTDGPGPDFAVFENAFGPSFLELAFVEVSSDGTNFFRFPSHTLATDPLPAYPFDPMEPESYGGLAGKHLQGFGTPFDLRTLAGFPGLDLRRVTHVRIVAIPGDGSRTDTFGHPIYDPHPTTGSGGFDLDAVGVLHPLVEIAADPGADAPSLPGFTTRLEHKATLDGTEWTPAADRSAPGFYRYRLVKE